ncbi:MAG TPA: OsmC family protein [Candidatus Sulfotelmatobacter sp.]|nr:OsmC family protein [Candidatus Sulfotelmatobacter sp.]
MSGIDSADTSILVRETGPGRLAETITVRGHSFKADEPVAVGGSDTGPNPYELLCAALGACTAMTLRLYADQKRWPLMRVSVRLSHGKIYARDCAECETREGRIDRIERQITLEGTLDATQRARLLEIAERCPVHRTLMSEISIKTALAA